MSIVAKAPPLALVGLTLLLASACKKSPLAPENEPKGGVDPRPVPEAMLGSGAPQHLLPATQGLATCDRSAAVTWRGGWYAPAGQASLGVGDDANPLMVGPIGSSGLDGFCTRAGAGAMGARQDWDLSGVERLITEDQWRARDGRTFVTAAVMVPNQQTVVLGVLNPDLDDCPDARVELLFRGRVVDRRTVSCEPRGAFQGGYLLGRLRPRGSLSPTIGRRYAAGPTGVSFEVVFAGTVGGFAWWGAEESGSYGPPPASSFKVDALRFDVSAVRAAALLESIVTASGSDGTMLLR